MGMSLGRGEGWVNRIARQCSFHQEVRCLYLEGVCYWYQEGGVNSLKRDVCGYLARSRSIETQDSAAAAASRSVRGDDSALWISRAAWGVGEGRVVVGDGLGSVRGGWVG